MGTFFPEIASDLSVFHRQHDLTAWEAERFGALVDRLAHYDGAVRAARAVQQAPAGAPVTAPAPRPVPQTVRPGYASPDPENDPMFGAAPHLGQNVPVLKVNRL
ncbi:hypothetical protein [Amycolatopsis albispora]|nr:hypothetical protein [Amycolatopsis albispora]